MVNPAQTSSPGANAIFIGGPTAVGKSAFALQLAQHIGGEIISVDSMQVYRGLDIGTAKPSMEERNLVPHHLIDVCDLHEQFDAAQFIRLANAAVAEIKTRQRIPILCGGTGLYFKAYLEGLGTSPATDKTLRSKLESSPLELLLQELQQADPVAFEKIDRKNSRRVIRAVEVIRLTGQPFSQQRADWNPNTKEEAVPADLSLFLCFTRSKEELKQRIDIRVDTMFAQGLVTETEHLLKHGLEQNQTAMQAIGYRQVVEFLRNERSLTETIELVKTKTRQFAKRQLSWFRAQKNLTWLELNDQTDFSKILQNLKQVADERKITFSRPW